jgi:hypothetical protein
MNKNITRPIQIAEILARFLCKQGYNPNRAVIECRDVGGIEIYANSDLAFVQPLERWKTYSFIDGSRIDLHKEIVVVIPVASFLEHIHAEIEKIIQGDHPSIPTQTITRH